MGFRQPRAHALRVLPRPAGWRARASDRREIGSELPRFADPEADKRPAPVRSDLRCARRWRPSPSSCSGAAYDAPSIPLSSARNGVSTTRPGSPVSRAGSGRTPAPCLPARPVAPFPLQIRCPCCSKSSRADRGQRSRSPRHEESRIDRSRSSSRAARLAPAVLVAVLSAASAHAQEITGSGVRHHQGLERRRCRPRP